MRQGGSFEDLPRTAEELAAIAAFQAAQAAAAAAG